MDRLSSYSQNFDRVMSARLKGQAVVEAAAIIGVSIYLSIFLESTGAQYKDFLNSKIMTAIAIGGCLSIVNHRPMLSLLIAVAYLAALSAVNKKAEAEKFTVFVPTTKPDFVETYRQKVQKSNDQMIMTGNSKGALADLYPESKPVDYLYLSGNTPWASTIGDLQPLTEDEGPLFQ